ncbi:MAG: hypothetical protein DRI61_06485 [Chloroflexi bacterium]|nr:MAG: hypothetical protein DRI61_06485 [Chloroflexota bacterium]HDN78847.1 hypothetical protein [Chloroflexota bacterium]
MKKWLIIGFLLFVVTLAAVAGFRLSRDSLAVIMGVVFGVAASIPTSLLIISLTRRSEARQDNNLHYTYPPVIIVNPGNERHSLPMGYPQPPMIESGPRQFRIIGAEEKSWEDVFSDWGGD